MVSFNKRGKPYFSSVPPRFLPVIEIQKTKMFYSEEDTMNKYTKLKRKIVADENAIIFRIEDFGAVGDGATEDGAAFMAAMEAITAAPTDVQKVLYFKTETT